MMDNNRMLGPSRVEAIVAPAVMTWLMLCVAAGVIWVATEVFWQALFVLPPILGVAWLWGGELVTGIREAIHGC